MENLSLEDKPTGFQDLPVELVRSILDQVVLTSGFYGALDLRLVNKLFDAIVLDAVLDCDRDSHPDLGYLDVSTILTITALENRVLDRHARKPALVGTIREIAAAVVKADDSLLIDEVMSILCEAAVLESGASAIFNYRIGEEYSSVKLKQEVLNTSIATIDTSDPKTIWWFASLVYAHQDNLSAILDLFDKKLVDLDRHDKVFGTIAVFASRYSSDATILWLYEVTKTVHDTMNRRQQFMRHITCYGKIDIIKHILEEELERDRRTPTQLSDQIIFTFMDCPNWATSCGQQEIVELLVPRRELSTDYESQMEQVFLAACTHGKLGIAKWVVDSLGYSPRPGLKGKGQQYDRPLCLATQSGNVELVEYLLTFDQLSAITEMTQSFKWAMRYADVDMVKLFFSKGVPKTAPEVIKATMDASRKGNLENLVASLDAGVEFSEGMDQRVVYETASAGYMKCLKVLRERMPNYEDIASTQIQNAWQVKDRRAVETFMEDGLEAPKNYTQDRLEVLKYEARIVPIVNPTRKKDGVWPWRWNYSTQF